MARSLADLLTQMVPPQQANAAYVRPGVTDFTTQLDPMRELQFRNWVQANNVPFNPDATGPQDYDMRGFYQGLQQQNPKAQAAVDPNDSRLHYPDFWKTPLHQTFSGESKFAGPVAPMWNDQGQLVSPGGRILFDDRKPR